MHRFSTGLCPAVYWGRFGPKDRPRERPLADTSPLGRDRRCVIGAESCSQCARRRLSRNPWCAWAPSERNRPKKRPQDAPVHYERRRPTHTAPSGHGSPSYADGVRRTRGTHHGGPRHAAPRPARGPTASRVTHYGPYPLSAPPSCAATTMHTGAVVATSIRTKTFAPRRRDRSPTRRVATRSSTPTIKLPLQNRSAPPHTQRPPSGTAQ
jgi:hypothetical protein